MSISCDSVNHLDDFFYKHENFLITNEMDYRNARKDGHQEAFKFYCSFSNEKKKRNIFSWNATEVDLILACEYSRLSFAPATTCETRRETSAIHGQKFHTDDVNLSGIRTGALIGQLGNLHNVCEI